MLSQTTRLELGIVAAVFLVLFLCREPPKSGNAGVRRDTEPTVPELTQAAEDAGQTRKNDAASNPAAAIGALRSQQAQPSPISPIALGSGQELASAGRTADNTTPEPAVPPARIRRIGVVDARGCQGLGYTEIMYGEVTARQVWDGQQFVWRTVCEVKEKNGVTSVWVFGEDNGAILSEIQQETP